MGSDRQHKREKRKAHRQIWKEIQEEVSMVTATPGRSATSNPATNPIQLLEMATSGCVLITSFFFNSPPFFSIRPSQAGPGSQHTSRLLLLLPFLICFGGTLTPKFAVSPRGPCCRCRCDDPGRRSAVIPPFSTFYRKVL